VHTRDKDILMVDNNPANQRLVEEALISCAVTARLHVVENGEKALSYLLKEGV
jgi:CheY-like chemotaxis protein